MTWRFLETLAERPMLLDAAMGTRLMARGLNPSGDDPALWVIEREEVVLEIHRKDAEAGAEAVLSNTFGANRFWLGRFGRAEQTRLVNQTAVRLARTAVGPDGFVLGSIGPTASDHPVVLREQAEILVECGVDALLLETHNLDQASLSLKILRDLPLPLIASLFAWPEPPGESPRRLIDRGAAAIGGNCMNGMAPALELARRLGAISDIPLLIKPSAGLPGSPLATPEEFAQAVPELIDCGVRLVGGCCGTTEAHVAATRLALDGLQKS